MASDVKGAILDAAIDCFETKGYEAASVQMIVDRANVTKGAFYHYFQSKEDLLLMIHDAFMDHEHRMIDAIVARGGSRREVLATLIEEIVVSVEVFKPHMTIFIEQRRFLSEMRFVKVKEKRDEFERRVVEIIDSGIAAGEFRDMPSSRLLAFGITGMCSWAYQWFSPGRMSARDIGRMYASFLLDGLAERA